MLIRSISLTNLLSFAGHGEAVALGPLNVLIGPNGSGKSNFLEAFDLLRSAPDSVLAAIRAGGGVQDWLFKGARSGDAACIEVVVGHPGWERNFRYVLSFGAAGQRFEIGEERIEDECSGQGAGDPYSYYRFRGGRPELNIKGEHRALQQEDVDTTSSILAQRKDPDQYPELTYLGQAFKKIRIYRDWSFGRLMAARLPQKADLPNDMLEPDGSNLGLVLNRLRRDPVVKERLLHALRDLYEGIDDYDVQVEGGTVQVFFHEGRHTIPATRLSDGTLRYLCLLTVLCHPSPPPLICIEEPELGLHPDILPSLADLMKEASTRTQLIVTTHSDILVDAMSDRPEAVWVCEKGGDGTRMQQLDGEQLGPWLQKYRLGELWTRGEIGGTRW
jgi:predicted ATPase